MPYTKFSLVLFAVLVFKASVCTTQDSYIQTPKTGMEIRENTNSSVNVSSKHSITTIRPSRQVTGKKWQVGRVSRKQFEIINMLWRKTNVFKDEENIPTKSPKLIKMSTPPLKTNIMAVSKPSPPVLQLSTMSFIEFYYMDEYLDSSSSKPHKLKNEYKHPKANLASFANILHRSPTFTFRFVNAPHKRPKFYEKANGNTKTTTSNTLKQVLKSEQNVFTKIFPQNKNLHPVHGKLYTTGSVLIKNSPQSKTDATANSNNNFTTANDKIKFFEMYDSYTRSARKSIPEVIDELDTINELEDIKKVLLKDVDSDAGHGPNKVRNVKKHIGSLINIKDDKHVATKYDMTTKSTIPTTTTLTKRITQQVTYIERESSSVADSFTWDVSLKSNRSSPVSWSKYPFSAVYVYERFQVHCDAGIISPHWLVASASCLSRHREDPIGEDRSAFVTYCGETWWNPNRITYVKYIVIHPRFHPTDLIRRNQYNIGVIKVVSSMSSSCPNWAPVSTMSHQYIAELEGSIGTAIGWGLDRYDTSYSSTDLPRHPLSMYGSVLYSNKCPGNKLFRSTEGAGQDAIKNLYCLSLPPYSDEDRDPVHGGLLLVGGKLIALFLQEERHRWGEQSAQYTGIWRLIPWVNEVARETEEIDFSF